LPPVLFSLSISAFREPRTRSPQLPVFLLDLEDHFVKQLFAVHVPNSLKDIGSTQKSDLHLLGLGGLALCLMTVPISLLTYRRTISCVRVLEEVFTTRTCKGARSEALGAFLIDRVEL
jgi:hypothetical protein